VLQFTRYNRSLTMRFTSPLALSLLAGSLSHALPAPQDEPAAPSNGTSIPDIVPSTDPTVAFDQLETLAEFAQTQVNASLAESSKAKRGTCNLSNVAVRREWGTLSNQERKAYTDAVVCLQKKQAKTPSELVPGAKSRYDDWVATHVNQTQTIHYTVSHLNVPCTFAFTEIFRVPS
jgi:tyrosinase